MGLSSNGVSQPTGSSLPLTGYQSLSKQDPLSQSSGSFRQHSVVNLKTAPWLPSSNSFDNLQAQRKTLSEYNVQITAPKPETMVSPDFWLDSLVKDAAEDHLDKGLVEYTNMDDVIDADYELTMIDFVDDQESPPKEVRFGSIQSREMTIEDQDQPDSLEDIIDALRQDYPSIKALLKGRSELAERVQESEMLNQAFNRCVVEELGASISQLLVSDLYAASQKHKQPVERFGDLLGKLSDSNRLSGMLSNNYLNEETSVGQSLQTWLSLTGEKVAPEESELTEQLVQTVARELADQLEELDISYQAAGDINKFNK
ncbi:hypothetical protein [Parendozoicomonas haliclonae]|uniref:Uncharacterized protein n=1 Tax=Parendozoicomonas haliclonae TaxID=1960125 RepID=A0A1X7AK29_9GAMM|nr:hypothetical protein [Parendozoicomonas haliclonae]SMA47512.1 hypothetical protein EHSB41UT_02441 [Parendozoicomonas haliclonae]